MKRSIFLKTPYFERLQLASVHSNREGGVGLCGITPQGLVPAHGLLSPLTHQPIVLLHPDRASGVAVGGSRPARARGWKLTFEPLANRLSLFQFVPSVDLRDALPVNQHSD